MEAEEDSKESGVSLKSKTHCFPYRVLIKSLFSGISCASAERDDSQGCAADVKETPPSPEEKSEDLIGADIDSVRDDEDWAKSSYSLMAKGSMESIDSGVSLKSDRSHGRLINFKVRVSPSSYLSSHLMDNAVGDDEDWAKSSDDPMPWRRTQSYPVKSNFLIPLRQQSPLVMAVKSVEAFGSALSPMNDSFIRNQQHSLSRMVRRRSRSEPVKSNFLIPLSQQSPVVMATRSFEAFGSSLSSVNDSFIRNQQRILSRMVLKGMDTFGSSLSSISDSLIATGQRSPPREEMNQELSSEV